MSERDVWRYPRPGDVVELPASFVYHRMSVRAVMSDRVAVADGRAFSTMALDDWSRLGRVGAKVLQRSEAPAPHEGGPLAMVEAQCSTCTFDGACPIWRFGGARTPNDPRHPQWWSQTSDGPSCSARVEVSDG